MNIGNIIDLETENKDKIYLHKSGLFWRAYERSAFLFIKYARKYKVFKKIIKKINTEVVYLGFPDIALDDVFYVIKRKPVNKDEYMAVFGNFDLSESEYENWKGSIPFSDTPNKDGRRALPENENDIIMKIRNFQTVYKSPMECQQFVLDLQNQLNGTIH